MQRKIVVTIVLALAMAFSTLVAQATPRGVYEKPNGVTVIGGEAVAPASMPDAAVEYAADQLLGG